MSNNIDPNLIKKDNDLGFGDQLVSPFKMIDSKGGFRVKRKGKFFLHPFQWILELSWLKFHFIILIFYVFVNAIFAFIYYFIGEEGLSGPHYSDFSSEYYKCFFFSVHTLTTVGYGSVAPMCFSSNIAASLESLIGLLFFAIITGLYFAKFTRPSAKILFSSNINFSPYRNNINGIMFRMANQRSSQLIEVEVQMTFSWIEIEADGKKLRRFSPLELERSSIMFFPLNWTVVHPITESSPFWGKNLVDLQTIDLEILCFMKGYDVTFGNQVNASYSYQSHEINWGKKFIPMYHPDEKEGSILDLGKINDTIEMPLFPYEKLESK